MASHGVAGEVYAVGRRPELLFCQVQHLHGVNAAPVFPVETPWAAVGGSCQVPFLLGPVCPGLANGLHASSMHRQKKGMPRGRPSLPGLHGIILQASVDFTDESTLVWLVRSYPLQDHLSPGFLLTCFHHCQLAYHRAGLFYLRSVDTEHHLPCRKRQNIREVGNRFPASQHGPHPEVFQGPRGGVHHHHRPHQPGGIPSLHHIGKSGVLTPDQYRSLREKKPRRHSGTHVTGPDIQRVDSFPQPDRGVEPFVAVDIAGMRFPIEVKHDVSTDVKQGILLPLRVVAEIEVAVKSLPPPEEP